MKSIRNIFVSLFVLGGFVALISLLHAQEETNDVSGLSDLEVELKAVEMTAPAPAADVPEIGTFWSAQHAPGTAQEWPPLPGNWLALPVWEMDTNFFLVDDLNYDYTAAKTPSATKSGGVRAMDLSGPGDPGDGSGDGGIISPMFSVPDYSTNLWLAITNLAGDTADILISNTEPDIEYEIQGMADLTDTNWVSEGFVLGSEITNWTPTSVAVTNYPNLFLRVRSWADDGSGLPIWWQLQNFGTTGVDPNALDSAGDGWTIYQKFQMGLNPNLFSTPPTPQGLAADYNSINSTAMISWFPSPGAVTGYTVEKHDGVTGTTADFSFSASANSFEDDVSSDEPDPFSGDTLDVTYKIQAQYGTNGVSAWGGPAPLLQNDISASIVAGPNGSAYVAVSALPPGTTALRLSRVDVSAFNDSTANTNFDIAVTNLTSGLYLIPSSWLSSPPNDEGYQFYKWLVKAVNTNGDLSAATLALNEGYTFLIEDANSWLAPPYFDGREQLKQNLIFLLRAATVDYPFSYTELSEFQAYNFTNPPNYAYAGFYQLDEPNRIGGNFDYEEFGSFDVYWPFQNNYRYRNFVFDPSELDSNGHITTGAGGGYDNPAGYPSWVPDGLILLDPPAYQFHLPPTGGVLETSETEWLSTYAVDSFSSDYLDEIGITFSSPNYTMASNAKNIYGLPFLSAKIANSAGNTTLYAGFSSTNSGYFYPETAQPEFQTAEYDFWNSSPLPGSATFSTTNKSDLLVTSVGNPNFNIVGYAKLAVLNGYSGVYGYLGQYFDQAYQMTNGVATTNTTGVLSPYGSFFATEPGPTALVTMPDVDTGERGTCTVYAVSLVLDKNHDGIMDESFSGQDATSASSPYTFWANQNFDRWDDDGIFFTPEQDDQQIAFCPYTPYTPTPDCNYRDAYGNRIIPDTRDLEDYTRLWVAGIDTNLIAKLPAGSTVTLNWGDVGSPNSANPTIDFFAAADADGGIGYQTNETIAAEQTNSTLCPYIGRLGPGGSIQLNASTFANNWAGNHFIWCGVTNGSGSLNMTIADGSGNVLAQTTAYIQIVDIKQMYERWTVGDQPSVAPLTNAILATEGLSAGESAFEYTPPLDTNARYILLVHGYNMAVWTKDRYAETAFKRLYWQGYQGRFGAFNWPTAERFFQFGGSESQAWLSAQGLLNKLNDLNAEYPGHVYLAAHSLGNVVAGEALRLASSQVVNTYVAMQGAVSAHAYDPTTDEYTIPAIDDSGTPDCYANYWTNSAPCYFNASAGAGTYVNFFNGGDFALGDAWLTFQNLKPSLNPGHIYEAPNLYYKNFGLTQLFFPTNTYELFSDLIQSRSYALGEEINVAGAFKDGAIYNQVELDAAPYNFGTEHIYHSGEFRSDNPRMWQFWNQVLVQMDLK